MSNELRQIMDDIGVLTGQLERISRSRRATGDVRAAALVQEAKEHSRFLATALGLAFWRCPVKWSRWLMRPVSVGPPTLREWYDGAWVIPMR